MRHFLFWRDTKNGKLLWPWCISPSAFSFAIRTSFWCSLHHPEMLYAKLLGSIIVTCFWAEAEFSSKCFVLYTHCISKDNQSDKTGLRSSLAQKIEESRAIAFEMCFSPAQNKERILLINFKTEKAITKHNMKLEVCCIF